MIGATSIVVPGRQVERLVDLAHLRNDPKELAGLNDHDDWRVEMDGKGAASSLFNHALGLIGEWAVATQLGGFLDTSIGGLVGDADFGDVRLMYGKTVTVKTRARRGWDLALSTDDVSEFTADYGALVWPHRETEPIFTSGSIDRLLRETIAVQVAGWCTRDDFRRQASRRNYGFGWRLVLGPDQLRPTPTFPYGG